MEQQHVLRVIDFRNTEHKTTFVKFSGYDHVSGKDFEGEVKFVGGRPYGDIIHPERSTLSPECIHFVQELLLDKYNAREFH
ncbi:hypothetical protein [Halalkalibacter flavus]|uniref:hypothetical protein n=1 Tax=Halalkalibacter flavus TaxID=3090668 RepID=UPI002FCB0D31